MELTADYHTHTLFSDANCTVMEQAESAKAIGLKEIAITDHGFTHIIFGLKRKNAEEYRRKIAEAERATGVRILVGIEENLLGRKGTSDLSEEDLDQFDLFLCGNHVFSHHESWRDWYNGWLGYAAYHFGKRPKGRLFSDMTKAYIETVKRNPVDILTHVNFQCYADAVEIAKCCRDYGTYLEISGKKPHFTDEELSDVAATGVRFVVNSDAHSPDRIGDVAIAEEQIERVGIPHSRIDNIDGRTPRFRLAEVKKRKKEVL